METFGAECAVAQDVSLEARAESPEGVANETVLGVCVAIPRVRPDGMGAFVMRGANRIARQVNARLCVRT